MAKTYNYTKLTGGTDGCLDALTDTIVEDGDFALGVVSGVQYSHYFDADSTTAASPPDVIEPISGSGRWLIAPSHQISGTWIPDLQFGGAKVGITYSTQVGYYLKVGDWVSCTFRIILTSKGTSTGAARLYGLPFPALSNVPVTVSFNKITYANQLASATTAAATYITFVEITEGGTQTYITNNDFADDSALNGSVFYKISS